MGRGEGQQGKGKGAGGPTHPQHRVKGLWPRQVKHEQRAKGVAVVYSVEGAKAVLACARVKRGEQGGSVGRAAQAQWRGVGRAAGPAAARTRNVPQLQAHVGAAQLKLAKVKVHANCRLVDSGKGVGLRGCGVPRGA